MENYGQLWRSRRFLGGADSAGPKYLLVLMVCLTLTHCGSLSLEQEERLGEQQVAELNSELNLVNDPIVVDYIEQLGASLIAALTDDFYEIRFRVIYSDALNAFAIAGGNIYVTTGAILASRNVAELASIMAHEIAHVQSGHIRSHFQRFRNSRATAEFTGITLALLTGNPFLAGAGDVAANLGSSAYIAAHTREAEREADSLAFQLLVTAGFDPRSQLTLLSRLQVASLERELPMPFLLSHPLPAERVADTRVRLETVDAGERWRVNDEGRLQAVQQLLQRQ